MGELNTDTPDWRYILGLSQKGKQQPNVEFEKVFKADTCILERPDNDDRNDPDRLSQTHLEQIKPMLNFEISPTISALCYIFQRLRRLQKNSRSWIMSDPAAPISIHLAYEGDIDGAVLRKLLASSRHDFIVGGVISRRGYGYLHKKIVAINGSAAYIPFLVLTDLDMQDAPPPS